MFLGTAYLSLGRTDDALKSCKLAIKLAPNSPDAHSNAGTVLHEKQRNAEAAAAYEQA